MVMPSERIPDANEARRDSVTSRSASQSQSLKGVREMAHERRRFGSVTRRRTSTL